MAEPKKPAGEVKREKVSIGLDFRPLPIDMGDGIDWEFTSDPDPALFNSLTNALTAFGVLQVDGLKPGDKPTPEQLEKLQESTAQMGDLLNGLSQAIAALLVSPKQQREFVEHGYGLIPLQKMAVVLVENLTGFPTA